MKKILLGLAVLAAIGYAIPANAATATSTAPAQQSRMKACAAQYHQKNLPKSQYKTFMSGCLKNPATAGTTKSTTKSVMAPKITPTAGPAPGGMAPAEMAPPPSGTMEQP
jgi:hypothetical protein